MFMSEEPGPIDGRSVNRTELASICGVTVVTIDAWRAKGCPWVERGGRGKEWIFDTAAVVDWRLQRAVTDAVSGYQDESGKVTADEADRRKKLANAITAEITADEALRQVVSRHDAEAAMAAFCQVLKNRPRECVRQDRGPRDHDHQRSRDRDDGPSRAEPSLRYGQKRVRHPMGRTRARR